MGNVVKVEERMTNLGRYVYIYVYYTLLSFCSYMYIHEGKNKAKIYTRVVSD